MWQSSPVWDINLVNFNFLCFQDQTPGVVTALERGQIAIGRMDLVDARDVIRPSFAGRTSTLIEKRAADQNSGNSFSSEAQDRLQSTFFFPVFDTHHTATRKPVAVLLAIMDWATLLEISPHWDGLVIVLATDCGESYSYKVDGEKLRFLGKGDLHNNKYDSFEVRTSAPSTENCNLYGYCG